MPTNWVRPFFTLEFLRYLSVGLVNTGIGVGTMAIGAQLGLHYALYTLIGYSIGMTVSFTLNMLYTFRTAARRAARIQAFALVNLVNLLAVQLWQALLIESLGAPELPTVSSGLFIYVACGFLGNKWLVFHTERPIAIWGRAE